MLRSITTTIILVSVLVATTSCGILSNSPSDAVTAYVDASRAKDAESVKQLLSKGTIEMFGTVAQAKGVSIEELLLKEAAFAPEKIELGKETIEGDTATVEIRNSLTGEFDIKIPLVREDGEWKLARDVYTRQVIGK